MTVASPASDLAPERTSPSRHVLIALGLTGTTGKPGLEQGVDQPAVGTFDPDRHIAGAAGQPTEPPDQLGEPGGSVVDHELRFDPTRRGQHTYCVRFGGPINTDVEQRFGHGHSSSSQWQRRLDEEADYRAVTDWRSAARPSVAGLRPRENRGRRCPEGRRTATCTGRHPGSRQVPTTTTLSVPVLRSVHQ